MAGAILAIALVGAGVAAYLQITPERVPAGGPAASTPGPSASTSQSLPTYAEVIATYPSGARIVPIEADILDYGDLNGAGGIEHYVHFSGTYKRVKIAGTFYLQANYTYDGSGPAWISFGDTRFYEPKKGTASEWDKYSAECRALVKKNKVFADLYHSTYATILGPRFTSYIAATIGDLEVSPQDKLTFDADQRLVKVSAR